MGLELYTTEHNLRFLQESNAIEGIKNVDYHRKELQKIDSGHFGAFVQSQEDARQHVPLSYRKIAHWQGMIAREQVQFGHDLDERCIGHFRNPELQIPVRIGKHLPPPSDQVPTLVEYWIERVNEALKDVKKYADDAEFCKLIGSYFLEFEKIHPFADGNGRVGRLLAEYIATYCGRPLIIFRSELTEKNSYYRAHDSKELMWCHMAKKIQEVVVGLDGQLLYKQNEGSTITYASADGKYRESVEWHALQSAAKTWQETTLTSA